MVYNKNTLIMNQAYTLDKTQEFLKELGNEFRYFVENIRIEEFSLKITIKKEILKNIEMFNQLNAIAAQFAEYFLTVKEGYNQTIRTNAGFKRNSGYQIRYIFSHSLEHEFGYNEILKYIHKQ